jgi:hypothetical protein
MNWNIECGIASTPSDPVPAPSCSTSSCCPTLSGQTHAHDAAAHLWRRNQMQSGRSAVHRPRGGAACSGRRRPQGGGPRESHPRMVAFVIEDEWARRVHRSFSAAARGLGPYLQEQTQVLPVIALGLPPDTGKPRHEIGLENEPWLTKAIDELRALQDVLGVGRDIGKEAPAPARFEELHVSGLVAEKVINDPRRRCGPPAALAALQRHWIGQGANGCDAPSGSRQTWNALREEGRSPGADEEVATDGRPVGPSRSTGQDTLGKAQAAVAQPRDVPRRVVEHVWAGTRTAEVSTWAQSAPCSSRSRCGGDVCAIHRHHDGRLAATPP